MKKKQKEKIVFLSSSLPAFFLLFFIFTITTASPPPYNSQNMVKRSNEEYTRFVNHKSFEIYKMKWSNEIIDAKLLFCCWHQFHGVRKLENKILKKTKTTTNDNIDEKKNLNETNWHSPLLLFEYNS